MGTDFYTLLEVVKHWYHSTASDIDVCILKYLEQTIKKTIQSGYPQKH